MDMNLMDRNEQVSYLKTWAAEIVTWCGDDQASAEEMVQWELENTEVPLPSWFDDHDRGLLVQFAESEIVHIVDHPHANDSHNPADEFEPYIEGQPPIDATFLA